MLVFFTLNSLKKVYGQPFIYSDPFNIPSLGKVDIYFKNKIFLINKDEGQGKYPFKYYNIISNKYHTTMSL